MAPEHAPVLHVDGAVMAPLVQMLRHEQQEERAMHRASMDQLLQQNRQLSRQLDRLEQKVDSNAHFYPLMAVAMAQLSQQMHGLAQSFGSRIWKRHGKSWPTQPGSSS